MNPFILKYLQNSAIKFALCNEANICNALLVVLVVQQQGRCIVCKCVCVCVCVKVQLNRALHATSGKSIKYQFMYIGYARI